jgi:hypothetical protein
MLLFLILTWWPIGVFSVFFFRWAVVKIDGPKTAWDPLTPRTVLGLMFIALFGPCVLIFTGGILACSVGSKICSYIKYSPWWNKPIFNKDL